MGVKWTTDLKPLKTTWEKPYLTQAHALVLLFKQIHGWTPDGRKKIHYYNEISCSISAGNYLPTSDVTGFKSSGSGPARVFFTPCGQKMNSTSVCDTKCLGKFLVPFSKMVQSHPL